VQPWVVGVSHETADVSLREAASLDAALIPSALAELAAAGAEEAVIVSTCNRTEFYLHLPRGGASAPGPADVR